MTNEWERRVGIDMLVFRILATVFVGISVLSAFIKNMSLFNEWKQFIPWTIWSLSWRAFVITAIWLI